MTTLANVLMSLIRLVAHVFGLSEPWAAALLFAGVAVVVLAIGVALIHLNTPILDSERAPALPRRKGQPWVL